MAIVAQMVKDRANILGTARRKMSVTTEAIAIGFLRSRSLRLLETRPGGWTLMANTGFMNHYELWRTVPICIKAPQTDSKTPIVSIYLIWRNWDLFDQCSPLHYNLWWYKLEKTHWNYFLRNLMFLLENYVFSVISCLFDLNVGNSWIKCTKHLDWRFRCPKDFAQHYGEENQISGIHNQQKGKKRNKEQDQIGFSYQHWIWTTRNTFHSLPRIRQSSRSLGRCAVTKVKSPSFMVKLQLDLKLEYDITARD